MAEGSIISGQDVSTPRAATPLPRRERGSLERWALFLLHRILWGLLVLFAIATITFFLTHYVPSDPAVYLAGPTATTETVNKIREQFKDYRLPTD